MLDSRKVLSMHVSSWVVAILLVIGGAVVLNHLGLDVGGVIANSAHALERALGQPL
jgi:hypothetical protein